MLKSAVCSGLQTPREAADEATKDGSASSDWERSVSVYGCVHVRGLGLGVSVWPQWFEAFLRTKLNNMTSKLLTRIRKRGIKVLEFAVWDSWHAASCHNAEFTAGTGG